MSAITHILQWLGPRDRARASVVSKEWAHAAEHPSLWDAIDLSGHQQAGAVLQHLLRHPAAGQHLRSLKLEFAVGVDDVVLGMLHGCALESINLNACQKVTDTGIMPLLDSSPHLRLLSLYWNLNVSDATLHAAAAGCRQLETLNLSGCKRVTDAGVAEVAAACPQLTDLDLTSLLGHFMALRLPCCSRSALRPGDAFLPVKCIAVTDEGLVAIGRHCGRLRVLRLYANSGISDAGLKPLAVLQHMEVLDLTGAALVTDEGVTALAACTALRQLVLSWCVRVGDVGVTAVAGACRQLELLSLHGLRSITDTSVEALAAGCAATLHTLDVNGCTGIRRRGRKELQTLLPHLRTFVVHT